jgi:hypothetical protein
VSLITAQLRQLAEVPEIGRARFSGTLVQKNQHWRAYRNFLRQGLSYLEASLAVPNRSAGLLLYYAAMNFAKAELLDGHHAAIVDKRIQHGLSFSPTGAKSVLGDRLAVVGGLFPMLYERRTGVAWPQGQALGVSKVLAQVPEIGTQVGELLGIQSEVGRVFQLIALDRAQYWSLLVVDPHEALTKQSETRRLVNRHYRQVQPPPEWRDHIGLSRRTIGTFMYLESLSAASLVDGRHEDGVAMDFAWKLRHVISSRTSEGCDAWLTPYLFKTKAIPLPASLARYALFYYASSLVRYKPAMFDSQLFPNHALLFDEIARECTLPFMIDTLSALTGMDHLFYSADSYRL